MSESRRNSPHPVSETVEVGDATGSRPAKGERVQRSYALQDLEIVSGELFRDAP